MEREPQEILKELQEKNIPVYSFSRLDTINNCLYEAYRTYILGDSDNAIDNIYAILGGRTHDILEGIMNRENTEADLLPAIHEELEDMDMIGIEFPKGRDGSDSIRQGWLIDMEHFAKTYKAPKGKFETETFFLYETPNHNYLQGYIDLTRIRKDGSIDIYDYKTSSMYKGDEIKKHGRQLVLYALGKKQQGYTVKTISWIMLKYVEVIYTGKKTARSKEETEIKKVIERKNLVKELIPVIEGKLQKYKVDEVDIELIVDEALERNVIPEILQCEFVIKPYVMRYELTDEIEQECIDYIDSTIEKWEKLDGNDENNFPPKAFTKITKAGKEVEDCFYDTQLCSYRKCCPHLQKFLDTYVSKSEDDNLW